MPYIYTFKYHRNYSNVCKLSSEKEKNHSIDKNGWKGGNKGGKPFTAYVCGESTTAVVN